VKNKRGKATCPEEKESLFLEVNGDLGKAMFAPGRIPKESPIEKVQKRSPKERRKRKKERAEQKREKGGRAT